MALLIGCAFFACVDDISGTLYTENAYRLLSRDSVKAWVRVSKTLNGVEEDITACADHKVLVFSNYSEVADTLYVVSQGFDCEGAAALISDKLVYTADGNLNNEFTYKITTFTEVSEGDSTIDVHDITSQYLRLGYTDEESEIIEIYNFDETVNDDLLIPEPEVVPDPES